jgi:hypothetical protein
MNDWGYAQAHPNEQLARLHFFSMKKIEAGGELELRITVKEFFTPQERSLAFFAQADIQTNQGLAPYTPAGWGQTLLEALEACVREVNRFPSLGTNAAM